ncbi:MAG: aspartate carbamoyltransferase catalytic subunit [Myxococcales bacterium]|nr:MAG: aspartate carbamoyltransferase catalytic subunit [Myxococcales bacterium]
MSLAKEKAFRHRHVLGIEALSRGDVEQIFDAAEAFFEVSRRAVRKVPTLRGKTIINAFFEPSTRTRTSFEIAGKRLSADVINVSGSSSSVSKGETLLDTCRTLQAMCPDVIVIRHQASGAADFVAEKTNVRVINAGDGMHEHPSQALLDAFALRSRLGSIDGLRIAICGDLMHSRVVRSNILLWKLMGCEVHVVGPNTLIPPGIERLGAKVFHSVESALEGADVVMALRIQQERLKSACIPSLREYAKCYGINQKRLELAKKNALVMHPGPMNRGVEIDPLVADGPQSLILDQVEAGVAVRMALLYFLAGDGEYTP